MKLLRFIVVMLIGAYICTNAEEPRFFAHRDYKPLVKAYPVSDFENGKNQINHLQATNIAVVDSMANAYAYAGSNNYFTYEPKTGSLVYIRRGFVDGDINKTYTGTDQKNNLLIGISNDWGKAWDPAVVVYDEKEAKLDQARYPSVAAYTYQGELYVSFTAPTVVLSSGTWTGYLTGFWNKNDGYYSDKQDSVFRFNNNLFEWSIQGKMAAFTYGANEDQMVMVAGPISPMNEDLAEASNIGLRSTTDFTVLTETIPSAWASGKFGAITQAGFRANELVGFETAGGKIYMGAHGNFLDNDVSGKPTVGVSVSGDNGATWSEFSVCPASLVRAYATSQGGNPDSVFVPYNSKGFAVLDNGDVSFVCQLYEYNALKPKLEDRLFQVIELYREGGIWGVRKIADFYPSYMTFGDYKDANNQPTNPNDIELQVSRTVDGKNLLAKWIELVGVRDTIVGGQTITIFSTSDIFVSSRDIGKSSWYGKKNASNSPLRERTVSLPNLLPNGLQGVPMLGLVSIGTAVAGRADSLTTAQYILVHTYDHTVGVEEERNSTEFSISGVYPNPANEMSNIDFTILNDGNVEISIVNMLGQQVKNIYSGFQTNGIHSVNFTTAGIPSGTYSCVVKMNGIVKSTLINVIR